MYKNIISIQMGRFQSSPRWSRKHERSQTRDNRKSGLKRKLGEIDDAVIKIKKLFSEILTFQIKSGVCLGQRFNCRKAI